MSASISIWLKDILPRTPGVVRSVAKRELINAAREFYRQSTVWREIMDTLSVGESTNTYASEVYFEASPSNSESEIFQIYSVEIDGQQLEGKSERPVGNIQIGTPTAWFPINQNQFKLWPFPDAGCLNMQVRAFLVPTETATTFPDSAYTKYYEGILDGVLGRLYGHPAKPYSNPAVAEYHLRRFRNFIGEAAAEAKQGGFAGQNWRFPSFGK